MNGQNQSPEEIERRIEETRQNMSATLDALQRRLDPSELMEEALGYVRENSADVGRTLIQSIRDNPVPAALIGIGAGWMALGGSMAAHRHSEHQAIGQDQELGHLGYESGRYAESERHGLADRAKEKWRDAKEKVSETAAKVKGRTSEMADRISDRTQSTSDQTNSKMQQASERAHELSSRATEKAQQARERSQELYQRSMERASQSASSMKNQYRQRTRRMKGMLDEHPMALLAIGIGVGAFLGAMIPTSRREAQFLSETGGQLREGLMEAGREQLERARSVAENAAHAVREQAEDMRSSSGSSAQDLSRKAGRATETLKQEAGSEDRLRDDRVAGTTPSPEPRRTITPPL